MTFGRRNTPGLVLGFGGHAEAALQQAARTLAETGMGQGILPDRPAEQAACRP